MWQIVSVCLKSCAAAKLASRKTVLPLLSFWLSVSLIGKEQGYQRLDWSLSNHLLDIQRGFPSFSICDHTWRQWAAFVDDQDIISWGKPVFMSKNLLLPLLRLSWVPQLVSGLLWQHLTCVPYCQVCHTDWPWRTNWQLLVTHSASVESLTGCQLEPI